MSNEELRAALYTATARRKAGLGRGLDAVIAGAEEEAPPAHVQPYPGIDVRLSIAESATGTTVTVTDGRGRSASVRTDWSDEGLRDAAIRAVSAIGRIDADEVEVSVAPLGGVPVMTILIASADGTRRAGAAVVAGTPAFTAVEAAVAAVGLSAG